MKSKIISFLLILTFASLLVSCQKEEKKITADMVLTNGKIVTVDDNYPEAEAIAIKGDTIMAVGNKADINKLIGDSTEVVDLKGRLAVPGLIESHAHFTGYGKSRQILKLREAKNWDDVIFMVAEAVETSNPGEWILGR
ncbi:MAG: amidohydrolase family protein, partial [Rhodothermaceae bacterium]